MQLVAKLSQIPDLGVVPTALLHVIVEDGLVGAELQRLHMSSGVLSYMHSVGVHQDSQLQPPNAHALHPGCGAGQGCDGRGAGEQQQEGRGRQGALEAPAAATCSCSRVGKAFGQMQMNGSGCVSCLGWCLFQPGS
jgi:hypothetical protein